MRRWLNVGLLLLQRRRRWANSKPTLGQRIMFAGSSADCEPRRLILQQEKTIIDMQICLFSYLIPRFTSDYSE